MQGIDAGREPPRSLACGAGAKRPLAHRDVLLPLLAGMTALAWIALFALSRSPYGRYLDHSDLALVCSVGTGADAFAQAVIYVGGFLLMIAAMMLPTTLPLIGIFRRMTRERHDRAKLVALLIAGYVGVWFAFGVAAHAADFAVHALAADSFWLQTNAWMVGAMLLFVAGAFQFTALKYHCLDQCRQPLSFVLQHWRGGNESRQAAAIGVHHGAYCVGCCWALMLLMFGVASGNIGWMLAIGAVMAIEKNTPWGRRLAAPLGVALLASSALVVLQHLPTSAA
jgi:predicted metal-binding membrane protein